MVDPQQAVDIDDAGMRLTLDIVGLVSLKHLLLPCKCPQALTGYFPDQAFQGLYDN